MCSSFKKVFVYVGLGERIKALLETTVNTEFDEDVKINFLQLKIEKNRSLF
jgi:hypothetical protein